MGILTRTEAEFLATRTGHVRFVTRRGGEVHIGSNHFAIAHRDSIDPGDIVDSGLLMGVGTPQAPELAITGKGYTAVPEPGNEDRNATLEGVRRVVAGSNPPIEVSIL